MKISTSYHQRPTHSGKPETRRKPRRGKRQWAEDQPGPIVGASLADLEVRLAAIEKTKRP